MTVDDLRLSDDIIEKTLDGWQMFNREQMRRIKQMDRGQLERFVLSFYKSGFSDCLEQVRKRVQEEAAAKHSNPDDEYEEVKADWEDVLRMIGEVEGIGPKLLQKIDNRFREEMG